MKLAEFDYPLLPERIAQTPADPRDSSRLMVLDRQHQTLIHRIFREIGEYLRPGDVLVLNKTRVIPARLYATKTETGGKLEILLLKKLDGLRWQVLVGGKGAKEGVKLSFQRDQTTLGAVVEQVLEDSERIIAFNEALEPHLEALGETPLPPYITTPLIDPERYQTVYGRVEGSAAAPTGGLHFTPNLLLTLQQQGIQLAYCTLHIGLDTFLPVKVEDIHQHQIHRERAILSAEDAHIINTAKLAGGRIIAVGTTSCRTLETAAWRSIAFGSPSNDPNSIAQTIRNTPDGLCPWRPVIAIDEETDLYITPGYAYRGIDGLITNFHLPKSTLLMMISAFAGRDFIMKAYQTAVVMDYRFFSFGDAMLLI
jgi:S-adenosylmethionine:tRNA ribosyltransferase-isomerase